MTTAVKEILKTRLKYMKSSKQLFPNYLMELINREYGAFEPEGKLQKYFFEILKTDL
jgi:hypothetical protein